MKKNSREIVLILHDIRSNHNVGSLFRTADCAGISEIVLSGYTPSPLDRFGRVVGEIAKTALGAEKTLAWRSEKDIKKVLKEFQAQKFKIIAIEQAKSAVDYKKVKIKNKTVLILGNEVGGLSPSILSMCDVVAEIPMMGKKESLNVSVAGGIAIFRILGV